MAKKKIKFLVAVGASLSLVTDQMVIRCETEDDARLVMDAIAKGLERGGWIPQGLEFPMFGIRLIGPRPVSPHFLSRLLHCAACPTITIQTYCLAKPQDWDASLKHVGVFSARFGPEEWGYPKNDRVLPHQA